MSSFNWKFRWFVLAVGIQVLLTVCRVGNVWCWWNKNKIWHLLQCVLLKSTQDCARLLFLFGERRGLQQDSTNSAELQQSFTTCSFPSAKLCRNVIFKCHLRLALNRGWYAYHTFTTFGSNIQFICQENRSSWNFQSSVLRPMLHNWPDSILCSNSNFLRAGLVSQLCMSKTFQLPVQRSLQVFETINAFVHSFQITWSQSTGNAPS